VFVFGGLGKENLSDFYELSIQNKKFAYVDNNQSDLITQLAEGPFYVLLSFLDPMSICLLSCASRFLRQRR
jgi:hypothetical protein